MAALSQRERLLRHGGHGGDGGHRGWRRQGPDGAARWSSGVAAGTVDGWLQSGLAQWREGAVGGEILGQEALDHLQGDGREVVLSHRGDPLAPAQVLRLVGADGVDGGQEVLGGRRPVGGQQAAVVSCRGRGGRGRGFRPGTVVTVVLDVRL